MIQQLGSRILVVVNNYPYNGRHIVNRYLKEQALPENDIGSVYCALLAYILHDKHTHRTLSKFFSMSKVPLKLSAAKWLLSILAKERPYHQANYEVHAALLNSGDLGRIFHHSVLQAFLEAHQPSLISHDMNNNVTKEIKI